MQKKNKLMLAAAIGMVAVVVATTAVRCSIARTADEAGAEPPAAAAEQPAGREGAPEGGARGEAGDGPEAIVEELRGTAWVGRRRLRRDPRLPRRGVRRVRRVLGRPRRLRGRGRGVVGGPALARRVPAAGRAGAGGGVHAGARGGRRRRLGGLGRLPPRRPVRGGAGGGRRRGGDGAGGALPGAHRRRRGRPRPGDRRMGRAPTPPPRARRPSTARCSSTRARGA